MDPSPRTLTAVLAGLMLVAGCGAPQHDGADQATASPSPSAAAAATGAPSPSPSVSSSPSPVPAAGGTAVVEATPWPANTPQIVVTGSPLATSSPTMGPVRIKGQVAATAAPTPADVAMLPPDAPPRILKVEVSQTTVHSGDTVSGYVQTSSNVASVEVRIATFSVSMPKESTGRFQLSYTVPSVPFFLHRTYPMQIIARNTRGDSTSTSIPISVR